MRVGDVIDGRFVLERRAGAGGMGVVFHARDLGGDGGAVAVKLVSGSAQDLDRFAREVAVLQALDHPRIVRYVGHGDAGEARFLAMEWLEGEDLARRLSRGRLDVAETIAVARGVAEGLAALHARGIVHRDVKPSNVFLSEGRCDQVKVLDLGIARTIELPWDLTGTGVTIGTPAYMAPEQARGEAVDPRADLFALGSLIFECLAGHPPFRADHPIAALARMLVEEAPSLADVGVAAPPVLESLLASLLAKDRGERPADGAAVLAILDAWSQRVPTSIVRSARSRLTGAEQRVVSVVLTRSATGGGATLLPQESGDLERRARAIAARHGVRLERLPNGSFLALFAGAGAPTDHAARGAAFALALAPLLGADTIALATGRGLLAERMPVGAVIERAVDLVSGGAPGIELDAVTASLLEGRFEIAIAGDGARRQLLGERDVLDPRRTLLGRLTACVGRERELAALRGALETCIEEPVASAMLITAPAGVGKSRLVGELVRGLRGRGDLACVLVGACEVMSAGSAFGALGRALRRSAQGEEGEGSERERLLARLRRRLPAAEAARTGELLGELCGVWGDDPVSETLARLRGDPILLGDALAEAWRGWLRAESEAGAVVIVLEDLHWGDLPSLKLIDGALRVLADRPIFVVASARPEIHELFPRLWAERGVQELRLGMLTRRTAERLCRQVLGAEVAPAIVAEIVERAGGHPFLLEELIRAADAGSALAGDVPDTVLGVVQARFDGLGEAARATLRAASVFGESFWRAGVDALCGGPQAPLLADLVAAEFLDRRPQSRFAGEEEYVFRHALVRDAAYAMLTDGDRRAGHRLAGAWLEAAGERDPRALAGHHERGDQPERAAPWLHAAAADALEGNDVDAAIELAGRALAHTGDPAVCGAIEVLLADAWYWRGDMAEAGRYAVRATERFAAGSEAWFGAVAAAIQSAGQQGRNDEVEAWLAQAVAVGEAPASDAHLICLCRGASQLAYVSLTRVAPFKARIEELAAATSPGPLALGWIERVRGETTPHYRIFVESAGCFERARRHFEAAGALRHACLMHIFQCRVLSHSGYPEAALQEMAQVRATSERLGVPYLGIFATLEEAVACFYVDDDARCLEIAASLGDRARGSHRLMALIQTYGAIIALDRGDSAEALRLAQEVAGRGVAAAIVGAALGIAARALHRLGREEEALATCERALAAIERAQPDVFDDVGVVAVAEVLLASGDEARARALIAAAWARIAGLPLAPAARERHRARRIVRDLHALARRLGLAGAG